MKKMNLSRNISASITGLAMTFTTLCALSVNAKTEQSQRSLEPIRIDITMTEEDAGALTSSKKADTPKKATLAVAQPGTVSQTFNVVLNTRGLTSLSKFPRKNFNVKSSDDAKMEIGNIKGKKLILSASPEDLLGTRNMFAYNVFESAGIRSLNPQYAEVFINGKPRGLYFVTRSADDEILKSGNNDAECVLRRRYADHIEEKGHNKDLIQDDCESYIKALSDLHKKASKLHGQELLDTLSASLNLDVYMKWMALNYLLKNGDYSDEVYFFGKTLNKNKGTPNEQMYFDILPWDNDDIDSDKAHLANVPGSPNRGRETKSREILIQSFESKIDKAIAKDPVLLKKYFQIALATITELAGTHSIQLAIESVITELTPYLKIDTVLQAGLEDSVKKIHEPSSIVDNLRLKKIDISLRLAKMKETLLQYQSMSPDDLKSKNLILDESSIREFTDDRFMDMLYKATQPRTEPQPRIDP